jgi:hypothetical protein
MTGAGMVIASVLSLAVILGAVASLFYNPEE